MLASRFSVVATLQQTLASGYGARYRWLRRRGGGDLTASAQDDQRVAVGPASG